MRRAAFAFNNTYHLPFFYSIVWAVILALQAIANNFASIMVLRYFLGTFESIISPGFSLMTAVHGGWFAGNSCGNILGGFAGYGINHITNFPPWKALFIIYGGITLFWGALMFIVVPDSLAKATFLNATEREIASARVASSQMDSNRKYDMAQIKEALKDPKVYILVGYAFLGCMGNGALTNVSF